MVCWIRPWLLECLLGRLDLEKSQSLFGSQPLKSLLNKTFDLVFYVCSKNMILKLDLENSKMFFDKTCLVQCLKKTICLSWRLDFFISEQQSQRKTGCCLSWVQNWIWFWFLKYTACKSLGVHAGMVGLRVVVLSPVPTGYASLGLLGFVLRGVWSRDAIPRCRVH